MMYGKLIDGVMQFAPKTIKQGDSITYNPTGDMLIPLGYLPVRFTDAPETDEQHYAVCTWAEIDGEIVQQWRIEEAEPTTEEILNILLGGAE